MRRTPADVSIHFRAPQQQIKQLDLLAKRRRRSRTQLIGDAIDQYLKTQDLHLARIREGFEAAGRGDFASEEEVAAEFARWERL